MQLVRLRRTRQWRIGIAHGCHRPGPGAGNVGSIILSDPNGVGPNNDTWGGRASITTAHITGDFAGDLRVVKDTSENGGEVTLTIDGNVSDNVTIPVPDGLKTRVFLKKRALRAPLSFVCVSDACVGRDWARAEAL